MTEFPTEMRQLTDGMTAPGEKYYPTENMADGEFVRHIAPTLIQIDVECRIRGLVGLSRAMGKVVDGLDRYMTSGEPGKG